MELDKRFSEAEIEMVLKKMNSSKAPGPDGAHALFFQKYWDDIKEDFLNIFFRDIE